MTNLRLDGAERTRHDALDGTSPLTGQPLIGIGQTFVPEDGVKVEELILQVVERAELSGWEMNLIDVGQQWSGHFEKNPSDASGSDSIWISRRRGESVLEVLISTTG